MANNKELVLQIINHGELNSDSKTNGNFQSVKDFVLNNLEPNLSYEIYDHSKILLLNGASDAWAIVIKAENFLIVNYAIMVDQTQPASKWIDFAKLPASAVKGFSKVDNLTGLNDENAMNADTKAWRLVTVNSQIDSDGTIRAFLYGTDKWSFAYHGTMIFHN
ncbi:hypothetical protein [uncultured Limosilactobacillus sp.]|uniref:hypothetical protein n=1 Tax=uncultured Limosilactobacillus sp. TaxID=2837629 RepID=UPI0025E832BA|nr:hypothetical protein [uncultured Limosilactobacillus sp.]